MNRSRYGRGPRDSQDPRDRRGQRDSRYDRYEQDRRSGPPTAVDRRPLVGHRIWSRFSFNTLTAAVLAGVLIVGIGIGSAVTSTTAGDQGNIASSQQLDMAVPDPEFCQQWGASAYVMDVEMYTTMRPVTNCSPSRPSGWLRDPS